MSLRPSIITDEFKVVHPTMNGIEGLGTTFSVRQLGLLDRIEALVEDVGVNSGEVGFTFLCGWREGRQQKVWWQYWGRGRW